MSPVQTVTYVFGLDMEKSGDPGRIRTCDHSLRRRVLYPAELRGRELEIAEPFVRQSRQSCRHLNNHFNNHFCMTTGTSLPA